LYILRKFGNGIAFFADFGLSAVTIWLLSLFLIGPGFPALTMALLAAVFIAVAESLFHIYMNAYVLDPRHKPFNYTENKLQTEFSDEDDFRNLKK
jgi:type III secretory pathway component EscV